MSAYVLRRLWQMIPTLAGVILLVFFLFNWVGGDPAYVLAGLFSNQEQIDSIRAELGFNFGFLSNKLPRLILATAGRQESQWPVFLPRVCQHP